MPCQRDVNVQVEGDHIMEVLTGDMSSLGLSCTTTGLSRLTNHNFVKTLFLAACKAWAEQ